MRIRGLLLIVFGLLLITSLAALGLGVATSDLYPTLGVTPEQDRQLGQILIGVLIALPVLVLLVAVVLFRAVGAPLRRVSAAILVRSQTGELTQPLDQERGREFRLLVESFNALQEFFVTREAELTATKARLEEVSTRDPLTRLHARAAATEMLELELRRSRRTGLPCSVLIVGMDDFEAFNDRYYRSTGDEVLVQVADSLRSLVRSTDVVGRWSGDQMMAILLDTGAVGARHVAENVLAELSKPQPQRTEHFTVSIGVASAEAVSKATAKDLMAQAEAALADAQGHGGNQIIAFV